MRLSDLTPDSPCPRIAAGQRYFGRWRWHREYGPCGLLWQHPGPCVLFAPGDYLPPPMLHPLDLDRATADRWRLLCPLCWCRVSGWNSDAVTAFRGDSVNWDRPSAEWEFTFEPCGCVGRVVVDG